MKKLFLILIQSILLLSPFAAVAQVPLVSLSGSNINCSSGTLTLSSSQQPSQIVWKQNGTVVQTVLPTYPGMGTTVAGGNGSGSAANQLSSATNIFVRPNGDIYIADLGNNRIQKWGPGAINGVTVAGGNGNGSGANQFSGPYYLYVDTSGNIYVSDYGNNRIQKWAPGATSGVTVAGGNGAGSGANQLNNPLGVYVDAGGNIYAADYYNHRIQKWTAGASSGTTVAGTGSAGSAANLLNYPTAVYVDSSGNVYVADGSNSRIQKWAPAATSGTTVAGGNGAGNGANQFNNPYDLYVDKNGSVYVADYGNNRIQKWASGATSGVTIAGTGLQGNGANQFNHPWGVFVDSFGMVYVADYGNNRIQKFNPSLNSVTVAGGNGAGSNANQLNFPNAIWIDKNGNTYVADQNNNRIEKWANGATSGVIVAGGNGAGNNANQLNSPAGVYVDTNGNIYVADYNNNRVQKWTAGATSGTTVAGGNGQGAAANQLYHPWGVFVDSAGSVYVSDYFNNRVQKWAAGANSGTTVAGTGTAGSGANQLSNPAGIYVDGNGNIYIADQNNNRVQEWLAGASTGGTLINGLNHVAGVFADGSGNVFATDGNNNRIIKWVAATNTTSIVAGGTAGSGPLQLNGPAGIFVDGIGSIYVADINNHRVQKFPTGINMNYSATSAGNYTASVAAQGGIANTSAFAIGLGINLGTHAGVVQGTTGISLPYMVGWGTPTKYSIVWDSLSTMAGFANVNNASLLPSAITISVPSNAGAGVYFGSLSLSNSTCTSPAIGFAVTVLAAPSVVSISGNSITCSGGVLSLHSNETAVQISWKNTGNIVQTVLPTYAVNGNTVAGTGTTAGNAANQLNRPSGVYVDGSGNMYIADQNNSRIEKWAAGATSGMIVAGGNGQGSNSNQLNYPTGMFADANGNIYVADQSNNRIQKWAPGATNGITVAGGNGQGNNANQLNLPSGIFVDDSDNIYVADFGNSRIQKWPAGATSGTTAVSCTSSPVSVCLDLNGNIYFTTQTGSYFAKWSLATSSVSTYGTQGSNADQLNAAQGIYVDKAGNIYIADAGNNRIQKWAPGAFMGTTVAGTGVAGGNANQFNRPNGVFADAGGNIYVADYNNNRVQKFTASMDTSYTTGSAGSYTASVTCAGGTVTTSVFTVSGIILGSNPTITAGTTSASLSYTSSFGIPTTYSINWSNADIAQGFTNVNNMSLPASPISISIPAAAHVGIHNGILTTNNTNCSSTMSFGVTILPGIPFASMTANGINCNSGNLSVYTNELPTEIEWKQNGTVVQTALATYAASGSTIAGGNGQGANANQLYKPAGVSVDVYGNTYVLDARNNRVQKWAAGANSGITVAGGNGAGNNANQFSLSGVYSHNGGSGGLFVDANGNIYVSDIDNNRVQKWAAGANVGTTVAGGNGQGSSANQLFWPQGIFVDGSGNIFVVDGGNERIQKWGPGATSGVTVAGGNGQGSNANQFDIPTAVWVDTAGNVYVTEWQNCRVQKWAPGATSGVTVAGGNGIGSAANQLNAPSALYMDAAGTMYITDQHNSRVQQWVMGASFGFTIAYSQLTDPSGVFVDYNGNLYVSDISNGNVLEYTDSINTNYTATAGGVYTATVFAAGGSTTSNADTIGTGIVLSSNPNVILGATSTSLSYTGAWGNPASYSVIWDSAALAAGFTNVSNASLPASPIALNIPSTATLGAYNGTITISNGTCTSSAMSFAVIIIPHPLLHLTSALTDTVCSGMQINYTPTSDSSATIFTWSRAVINNISPPVGNGNGNINETLVNSSSNEIDVVYRIIMFLSGYADTTYVTTRVFPIPIFPGISTKPLGDICSGSMYQNFGCSGTAIGGTYYTWSADNAAIWNTGAGGQYCLVNFGIAGTGIIKLRSTYANTGCSAIATDTVMVNSNPAPTASVIYVNSRFICLDNTADSYQWGYDDASSLDSSLIQGAVYDNYYLSGADLINKYYWVLFTKGGCMQKAYYNVPPAGIGNISQAINLGMSLYPNPAKDILNIKLNFENYGNTEVILSDISGRTLLETKVWNKTSQLNIGTLSPGIYMVSCYRDGIKMAVSRVVKN